MSDHDQLILVDGHVDSRSKFESWLFGTSTVDHADEGAAVIAAVAALAAVPTTKSNNAEKGRHQRGRNKKRNRPRRRNHTTTDRGSSPHHQDLPPSPAPSDAVEDNTEPDLWTTPLNSVYNYIVARDREGETLPMLRSERSWEVYHLDNYHPQAVQLAPEPARSFCRFVVRCVEQMLVQRPPHCGLDEQEWEW